MVLDNCKNTVTQEIAKSWHWIRFICDEDKSIL